MLCLHFQRNTNLWRPFLQPLWPASENLFSRMEQDMIRTVEEIKANMKRIDQFHQQLMQEMALQENTIMPMLTAADIKPIEGGFVLSLGVQDLTPQELTVKLLGRKLLVTGVKETKNDDGKGSFSYKCQIFRKEADLPQDVRAEDMSCTITTDGQLRIEAPWKTMPAVEERTVPIQLTAALQANKQKPGDGKEAMN
ncbi:heat shock protein beta-11-like [Pseudophryne corroboree]|uniref:heat shock protein beta-11-like n=1 Tax=Pseudophryne corroboree TaxID=495146 RepID=UPI0030814002